MKANIHAGEQIFRKAIYIGCPCKNIGQKYE